MLNNPLLYTDITGDLFGIDDLIFAAIGGTVNLISNALQGNIHSFGQGLAAFGAGAAAGALATYGPVGWAAGGAILGGTNAWLGGARSFGDIATGSFVGAFSGLAGGALGQWAGKTVGGVLINGWKVNSPIFQGIIAGGTGGFFGGYAGGFTAGLMTTGNFNSALKMGWQSAKSGAVMGGIIGAGSAYKAAKDAGLNPWSGKPKQSVVIGEGMSTNPEKGWFGVDRIAEDLNSDYYKPDPRIQMNGPFKGSTTTEGMYDNAIWIEMKMSENYIIFDRGTVGNNSLYYNMELGRTMNYNNIYHVRAIYNHTQTIRILIVW